MIRNIVCLLLCLSLSACIIPSQHESERRAAAYRDWYNSLSPAQQDREDRRNAAAMQALGLALSGGGPTFYEPPPVLPRYQSPTRCYGTESGSALYVNCY